jgi:hypothetical protein
VWGKIGSQIGWCEGWLVGGRLGFGGRGTYHSLSPRLYSISTQKEAKVGDFWRLQDGVASWNLCWRRQSIYWEDDLIQNLSTLIEGVVLGEEEDVWMSMPEEEGHFLVLYS